MPEIGELCRSRDIGAKGNPSKLYIWLECDQCKTGRWAQVAKFTPKLCLSCRKDFRKINKVSDKSPARVARHKAWQRSEKGRASDKARRLRSKVEIRAKNIVSWLIEKGDMRKQSCIKCGNPDSVGHHPDYSKPTEVTWLCRKHHYEEHLRIKHSILV